MTDQTTPGTLTPETVNAIVRNMDDPRYPTQITVYCDRYGCETERTGEYMVSAVMDSGERLAVARKHLVDNEGWQHTDEGDDFCPEHAAAPAAEEEQSEVCGKCRTPFDPADTRFDGHAQHKLTPYCRRCVDLCHDNEIADHRCVICREGARS